MDILTSPIIWVMAAPAATKTITPFLGVSTPRNYPCSIRYHFNRQPSPFKPTLTKQSTPTSPPGRARRPCASGGRALGWAIKNSRKTSVVSMLLYRLSLSNFFTYRERKSLHPVRTGCKDFILKIGGKRARLGPTKMVLI
jgi:hypothetical protein